jgi:hypothetical protein
MNQNENIGEPRDTKAFDNLERALNEITESLGRKLTRESDAKLSPAQRTAAVTLLLRRADQLRRDRKLDLLEALARKKEPSAPSIPLTAEEKDALAKQVLGIE